MPSVLSLVSISATPCVWCIVVVMAWVQFCLSWCKLVCPDWIHLVSQSPSKVSLYFCAFCVQSELLYLPQTSSLHSMLKQDEWFVKRALHGEGVSEKKLFFCKCMFWHVINNTTWNISISYRNKNQHYIRKQILKGLTAIYMKDRQFLTFLHESYSTEWHNNHTTCTLACNHTTFCFLFVINPSVNQWLLPSIAHMRD